MDLKYTPSQVEEILEYWYDVSQDPEFISTETGIDINVVKGVISDIEGEENINELLDSQTLKDLNIKDIKHDEYFFNTKRINKEYNLGMFKILVDSISLDPRGMMVTLNLLVTYRKQEYKIGLSYLSDENVFYHDRSKDGFGFIHLKNDMGSFKMAVFGGITQKILEDLIPEDFWEVRSWES